MKIAIVVPGRFHAFDLARALLDYGEDVTLFTNYPKKIVQQFGFPMARTRSFLRHGLESRILSALGLSGGQEARLHRAFGAWAARSLSGQAWDVLHVWSGVAEETFSVPTGGAMKLLMRGSAHIDFQKKLLEDEARRTGVPQDLPSDWMVAREKREYALADRVRVLSRFSYDSFIAEGVPAEKMWVIPSGMPASFKPSEAQVRERSARILGGGPLRVLFVGMLSYRKGLWDLTEICETLKGENFHVRCVGAVSPEAGSAARRLAVSAELLPKVPQDQLLRHYAWADVFVFPTIEDGFAQVLAQAVSNGLPTLTTPNSAAPELIRDGKNGWILPIRSAERFVERLRWCQSHRAELADLVSQMSRNTVFRTWQQTAEQFTEECRRWLNSISKEGRRHV